MTSQPSAHPSTAPPPAARRQQRATGHSTLFPSPSIGSLRKNLMPTPGSCSPRSMAAWRAATLIATRSIPRLDFASASERSTGGADDRHGQSGRHLSGQNLPLHLREKKEGIPFGGALFA